MMREKLIDLICESTELYQSEYEAIADKLLDNDVVPVVRCKDCKHLLMRNGASIIAYCPEADTSFILGAININTHFCGLGERKKDD